MIDSFWWLLYCHSKSFFSIYICTLLFIVVIDTSLQFLEFFLDHFLFREIVRHRPNSPGDNKQNNNFLVIFDFIYSLASLTFRYHNCRTIYFFGHKIDVCYWDDFFIRFKSLVIGDFCELWRRWWARKHV